MDNRDLTTKIKLKAIDIGCDLVGICSDIDCDNFSYYTEWVKSGFYGTMTYMAKNIDKRASLNNILPNARSIIACGFNYCSPVVKDDSKGIISMYAQNKDYHKLLNKKLKSLANYIRDLLPGVNLRYYCDTGPILEKYYAQKAGLGWVGKNTCLINKGFGSWIFLGEIIIDTPLIADTPSMDYCGSCTKCIESCPTGALVSPYKLDARRCISYLTIEFKGGIPKRLRDKFSGYIFGCDICQDVCPWNKGVITTNIRDFHTSDNITNRGFASWLSIDEQDFVDLFSSSPIRRTGFHSFMRNVVIGVGSSGNVKYIPALTRLLKRSKGYLRSHIHWAISKLLYKF